MILFFEQGRVGNQLFQYKGLRHYFPANKIIWFGSLALASYFEGINILHFPFSGFLGKPTLILIKKLALFLAKSRILGLITEKLDSKSYKPLVKRGLLWFVFVTENLWFQHSDFIVTIDNPPTVKSILIEKAKTWIENVDMASNLNNLVFVHVRRGDYLYWPSRQFPAVLSLNWYQEAIELMRKRLKSPKFLLMGDDLYYLKDVFDGYKDVIISPNDPSLDFTLMTMCHSGIMSASSFAWWGSYIAYCSRKGQGNWIAPKYWGGHRRSHWFPLYFKSDWIEYI